MKVLNIAILPFVAAIALMGCGGGGGGGGGGFPVVGLGAGTGTGTGASTGTGGTGTGTSTGSAPAGDVVGADGNVDAAAYKAMAAQMSKDGGIAYRFGPASGVANAGLPSYPQPASKALTGPYTTASFTTYYQVGGPQSSTFNDFSANQAQALFVADNPAAGPGAGGIGVTRIETLAMRENTFTQSPGLSWTTAAFGLDDPSAQEYGVRGPVAAGRCYGRPGWCYNSLVAFQNGLIGTAGSNTSNDPSAVQLDAGLVPTAVAVTNGGEFGFVTVWDTVNVRGRLAVLALSERNRPTWKGLVIPGIPNEGAWGFLKVIGYVDLPDMKAPTDVSVSTGLDPEGMHRIYLPGQTNFVDSTQVDLRTEAVRQTFADGATNANTYARAGIAVVTSKSERKVSFVDLKPLFAYYRSTYFTANDRTSFDNAVNNLGPAANQWPRTFSAAPSQTPTVIKTVALAARPTAVKVSLSGTQRAWVATEDGVLHIYNVGEYTGSGNATPATIAELGTVPVGKNPTHIAYDKQGDTANSVIVVSRGERKIDWVSFSGNGGSITRTLRDTRLVDPVAAEDNDNHGTTAPLLTVADYGGKQIANYRYGSVVFISNPGGACPPPSGCGLSGGQPFEFGGAFTLPGRPFLVSGANVI